MSSKPGVEQTLEWLNRLKSIVQDFAAREESLNQEFRLRISRERQQRTDAMTAEAVQLETQSTEADATLEAAKAKAETQHERRKAKIARARTTSKEQNLERIEKRTGARKYELQKRLMQSEHDRDATLGAAAAAFQESRNHLAAEQEELWKLESAARRAFRGYGSFRRLLPPPPKNRR